MSQDVPGRPSVAVASDLRARVLAEVARTPSPTRAVHHRRVTWTAALGAIAVLASFLATGGANRGARPVEMIAFTAGLGAVAASVVTHLASGRGGSMLGRPRPLLLAAVVIAAPLLALVVLGATMIWPEPAAQHVAGGAHLSCGALSLLQGAIPLAVLLAPRRGTDPVHPVLAGAALGMTAGAWAAVLAALRCTKAAAVHGLVAHVGPALILTALGAALGWLLLRVRSES